MRLSPTKQGCFAAAAAAVLYGLTTARGVGAGDSGELILAARGLGIAHPPGYALWLLFARLAAALPWGPLAFRVNMVSAVTSAVAVGLFWILARRSGLRAVAAGTATVLFGTASIVWSSAVETEVYGLAIAAFFAMTLLAIRARELAARGGAKAGGRAEGLFFFAAGLATVAHQTLLFPAVALSVWVLARSAWSPRRAVTGLLWAALGASITLVIPIRWSAGPAFAWTDVRGLGGLADYLLRRTYGGLAQNPFRLDRAFDEAAGMAGMVASSLGVIGTALAVIGAMVVWRSRRASLRFAPMMIAALTVPAALAALIRFTPDAEHLAQVAPFLAPVVAATALLAGAGVQGLQRVATRIAARRFAGATYGALVGAALLLATVILIPGRWNTADRSRFTLAERYGRDLLRAAPPHATLILDGDNETFLAAWAAREDGLRPDVTLRHRRGWIFGDPYGLRSLPRAGWTAAAHQAEMARLGAGASLCYALPPADLLDSGVAFTQHGLLYRADLASSTTTSFSAGSPDGSWTLPSDWPRSSDLLGGHPEQYDYVTRKMAVSYSDAAARWLWSHGRTAEALPWFLDAARVGFDFPGAHLNAATALAASGDPDRALDEWITACRIAPYDPEPRARLAVFLAAAGRPRDAALWFERAFRVAPNVALAADASRAWALAGDPERARAWSARAGQASARDAGRQG